MRKKKKHKSSSTSVENDFIQRALQMAVSDEDAQLIENALLKGPASLRSNEVWVRIPVDSDLLKEVQSLAEKEGCDYPSFIQKILGDFIIQQKSNVQEGGSKLTAGKPESRRKAA